MPKSLTPDHDRASTTAWWMLAVLLGFYTFSWVDRQIIVMLVKPIQADLGLSDFGMSLILGPAFGICIAVLGLPLAWTADRFDRRIVILLGTFVWSMATVACGLVTSFSLLFLGRMVVAAGEAALTPAAHSLLSDSFPQRRLTTAMAVYTTGSKLGTSLAFGFGGLLIAALTAGAMQHHLPGFGSGQGWRLIFVMVGAPGFLLAWLVFTFPKVTRRRRPGQAAAAAGGFTKFLLANWQMFLPMLLGFCSISIASVALTAWTPTYMDRHFSWTPGQYGPALGVITAIAAFTLVLKGWAVDWLYSRGMKDAVLRFYTWLLGLFIPLAVAAFFLSKPFWFLIGYGALAVVAVPYNLYASAAMQMVTPVEFRARGSGLFLFAGNITGSTFGPTIVGALNDFVFRDPAKLGLSLGIVTTVGMGLSFLLLRVALRRFGPMIEQAQQ